MRAAGTSMGGLVTGAFVAGLSPDEMLTAMGEAGIGAMFNDNFAEDLNLRVKIPSRRFIPAPSWG